MDLQEKKFSLYLTVLRFLSFKITENLRRIYLDIDSDSDKILLTAFYRIRPSELELELLDDIVTNSNAHIPDLFVYSRVKLMDELDDNENRMHDFVVFSFYYESSTSKEK
jgi:hypothetical protein